MSDEKKTTEKTEKAADKTAEKTADKKVEASTEPKAETVRCRLKPGAKFAQRLPPLYMPVQVASGTVVDLTPAQAVAFRDLFERVDE